MILTNDQQFVLDVLRNNRIVSGREIRRQLNDGRRWFQKWSHAGFYQMMANLENAGYVNHFLKEGKVKEWFYQSTDIGKN